MEKPICRNLKGIIPSYFLSLEVVDRGSETQLHVGKNSICIAQTSVSKYYSRM